MRKLLLLFVCALVSIGAWAAPNIGGSGTVYLTGFGPGDLAKVLGGESLAGLTGSVDALKGATKIYFGDDNGSLTLNDADLAALANCTSVTQLDMGKARLAEGTDITKLASTAQYIELPFGEYTKTQLAGLSEGNNNLKFAAALTSKGSPEDYIGYSYEAGNLKNFADQGLMSISDLCSTATTVTLYGNLNSTDLGNINNVLHVHQHVTDISEATLVDGAALSDVNGKMDASQFLIIPNDKTGTFNSEWTNYSLSSTEGYPHFGFFTDADKKQLYAHYGDNTSGNDLQNLANFVDGTMALTVLPTINSDGSFGSYLNGSNDQTAASNTLTGLGALTLGCVDLSWFNMSGIKTNDKYDYSKLTHVSHLVIPHNSNQDDMSDASKFIYPDNIKTVADYSSKDNRAGQIVLVDGQLYQFADDVSATTVLVRTAGSLDEAHSLWNPRMTNASTYVAAGTLNASDVTALSDNGIVATTVDLHHATVTGIEGYENSHVEYLALPDGQGSTINATSATQCAYSGCASLKCVAAYNPDENKLYTFSTQVGCIKTLTDLIRPQLSDRYTGNSCTGLAHLVMSGTLNHDDINETTNTDATTNYGLSSASIETTDLTWAVFPNQDDMCFNTAGGYEALTHIDLPITSQTKLPASCFENCQKLPEICIPGTYEEIGGNAFKNCGKLTHILTTGVDADATSFRSDMGENTITLPPSLKKICTGAFYNVKKMTDVYITTPNDQPAPECEEDAFDATTYWGYNTVFDGGRGWDRVRKTENDEITAALAYLHWPESDGDRNKIYTDITRAYSIPAYDTVVDVNGDVIYFPSQAEMVRSYVQGKYGYTWESWGTERNSYTSQTSDTPPFTFYDIVNPSGIETGSTQNAVDAVSDGSYVFDKKYAGWHQFVLSANYSYIPRIDMSSYKENDWYTICVPYDLTKEDLLSMFGAQYEEGKETKVDGKVLTEGQKVYPKVVTLTGAKRDKENSVIYLHMSKDLLANNVQWNFDEFYCRRNDPYKYSSNSPVIARNNTEEQQYVAQTDADPVVIKAGYPYLIKPFLSEADLAAAQAGIRAVPFSKNAILKPFMLYKVTATNENGNVVDLKDNAYTGDFVDTGSGNGNEDLFSYFFVGTFERINAGIPTYAYYLGKAKSGGKHRFFRHTASTPKNWSKYACIILPNPGKLFYDSQDGYTPKFPIAAQDDSFTDGAGNAKATSFDMFFDEGEVTGIREIGKTTSSVIMNNGKVYTVNGQFVGNSIEGLAKGLYIVNGKKYVVK